MENASGPILYWLFSKYALWCVTTVPSQEGSRKHPTNQLINRSMNSMAQCLPSHISQIIFVFSMKKNKIQSVHKLANKDVVQCLACTFFFSIVYSFTLLLFHIFRFLPMFVHSVPNWFPNFHQFIFFRLM